MRNFTTIAHKPTSLPHNMKCRVSSRIDKLLEVKQKVFVISQSSSSPGTSLIDGDLLKDTA